MKKVENMKGILAITMPPWRAEKGLALTLLKKNIPSYIHTNKYT